MISNISFPYPLWYIFICLLLGLLYATFLYFKENKFADAPKWLIKALGLFRTITVSIIAILLLAPVLKTIKEYLQQPLIVFAIDESQSVSTVLTNEDKSKLTSTFDNISEVLKNKYDIKTIRFGGDVQEGNQDSIITTSTNMSGVFDYISANYSDQNLGAVILATDGIYNEGTNPLYLNKALNAPLYTIALGDTVQRKDLYIQNVFHNKIAYLEDKFNIQVDISAFNCSGSATRLSIDQITGTQVKKIFEENINITDNSFFTTKNITADANQAGVIKYRVNVSAIKDEFNVANNSKTFFVEVLDARQKILLFANAPHPDIAALKQIITGNKNYDVNVAYANDANVNVSAFDMVLFHNLPSDAHDIQSYLNILNKKETPRMYFVGAQTSLAKFNLIQDVIRIGGNSRNNEEIQGELNPGFNLFTSSDQLKNKLRTFPPLITPFGEYKSEGNANVFLYQNIKKIKTNYPLLSFGERNGINTGVFCGEGIWRWRIFDYLQHSNYDIITELVNKSIQLVSAKEDKRKFRVSTAKNIYKETDNIVFDAQLYNDNYELVNDPDVQISIKNESGEEYKYTFSKTQNYYTLNAGLFAEGSYNYTAITNFSGRQLTVSGKFNVESIQLEQFDLTARHALLKTLSEKYNGQVYHLSTLENLEKLLKDEQDFKPVLYLSSETKSVLDSKWLFFLLLFFLSVEWFFRRYFGSY